MSVTAHRLGDCHEETEATRRLLARNLRLQFREDEASSVERVNSWSKRLHGGGGGGAADTKHQRDDKQ
jgi:hypothetical protein